MPDKSNQKPDNSTLWITIITIGLTVLIVGGVALSGKKGPSAANLKTSQLQTDESNYDFGSISMAKGKVSKTFTFQNTTSQAVTAKKLYTSCMCTQATLAVDDKNFGPFGMPAHGFIPGIDASIEPGAEAKIEAVFDPAAHGPAGVGPIAREVILETSDGKLTFKFKAQVLP